MASLTRQGKPCRVFRFIDIRYLTRLIPPMNIAATGNTIYAAIKDDSNAQATIRAEFSSLALAIATDPNASARITSATVNGQMFSTSSAMTNGQRLSLLRWVVACLDNKGPISAVQITTF